MTQAQQHGFELFWHNYPRKVGKLKAQQAWERMDPDLDAVLAALCWQRESEQWQEPKFIPHPATYLRAGRWLDEPLAVVFTAAELRVAEAYRAKVHGRCPHEPRCTTHRACLEQIAVGLRGQ